MEYTKVTFSIANESIQEALAAMAEQLGFDGFEFTNDALLAFVPTDLFDTKQVDELLAAIPDFQAIAYTHEPLPNINWNEEWEKNYPPVLIGNDIYIRASFHPSDTGARYEIVINPKMSFGTGHHETTWMMAETMLAEDFSGKRVLDFGSGTAILAILAAKMGAGSVLAIDHEEWAYKNALENVELNGIANVHVIHGDEMAIPSTSFDTVLANVNKNVIIGNLHRLSQATSNGGFLYLSGLLEEDAQPVIDAALPFGFELQQQKQRNRWICLKLIKNIKGR
ncbi:MAG: 50S ribosomal protein L11 methyltransferase [Chitinophagales bacterium]|nr:50S ribosomal protein L11 methyltransferase [Chitinophagales bacterium]